jgi:hypothetical protein
VTKFIDPLTAMQDQFGRLETEIDELSDAVNAVEKDIGLTVIRLERIEKRLDAANIGHVKNTIEELQTKLDTRTATIRDEIAHLTSRVDEMGGRRSDREPEPKPEQPAGPTKPVRLVPRMPPEQPIAAPHSVAGESSPSSNSPTIPPNPERLSISDLMRKLREGEAADNALRQEFRSPVAIEKAARAAAQREYTRNVAALNRSTDADIERAELERAMQERSYEPPPETASASRRDDDASPAGGAGAAGNPGLPGGSPVPNIVDRLRNKDWAWTVSRALLEEAAAEIERLRAVLKDRLVLLQDAYAQNERLKAEVKRLNDGGVRTPSLTDQQLWEIAQHCARTPPDDAQNQGAGS